MGHEASGIVHAVGPAVSTLKPGDPAAIEPGFPCRRCSRCKMGKYNLCPHMQFAASPPTHGTLCKYFRIPDDCCYKINTSASVGAEGGGGERAIGLDEAALIEPLAVAVHSVRQGGVQHGDKVVVFGAGTVGLLCAAVAREFGAAVVTSVDIRRDKLDAAEAIVPDADGRVSFGTAVPDASLSAEENAEILCRMMHRDDDLVKRGLESDVPGYDVAIEATGAEACIQMGVFALRVGGSFVQTGLGNRVVGFPVSTVAENEICVKGCFRYGPGDFGLALELVLHERIGLKRLITKVVSFEEVAEAWETTRRGEGIKTLIRGVGFTDDAGEV